MAEQQSSHQRAWLRAALIEVGVLVLLILLAVGSLLILRPPRRPKTELWFEGVTYNREVREEPRPLVLHIVAIDLEAPGIGFAATPGDPQSELEFTAATTTEFLRASDTQVAINGSFFSPFAARAFTLNNYYPHRGDPVGVNGLAISDGVLFSPDEGVHPKICIADTQVQIMQAACPTTTQQAVAGNRMLVAEGQIAISAEEAARDQPHPRTAVGIDTAGQTLWWVVVDGRQRRYSEGVSMTELAEVFVDLGAAAAVNLDGGGSSTLVRAGRWWAVNAPIHTRIPMRQRPVANHLGLYAVPLQE